MVHAAQAAAYREAVLREITSVMSETALEANRERIEREVLAVSEGYVAGEEFVSDGTEGGDYVVTLRVSVDRARLREGLDAVGVALDERSRRSVALVIEEYFVPDFRPSGEPQIARELDVIDDRDLTVSDESSAASGRSGYSGSTSSSAAASARASASGYGGSAQASAGASNRAASSTSGSEAFSSSSRSMDIVDRSQFSLRLREYFPPELRGHRLPASASARIGEALLAADIRLVDEATVDRIRTDALGPDGYLADFIGDDSRVSEAALRAHRDYGADALIIGVVNVVYDGTDDQGGERSVANLAVTVVDAATGAVLASTVSSESGIGTDAMGSAVRASIRLGQVVGPDLADQLVRYFVRRADRGDEYTLRFTGVTRTAVKMRLVNLLGGLELESVEERAFDRANGLLEVVVTHRGGVTAFKQLFLRAAYAEPEFESLEEQASLGNTISFVLAPR